MVTHALYTELSTELVDDSLASSQMPANPENSEVEVGHSPQGEVFACDDDLEEAPAHLRQGVAIIRSFVKHLPSTPGVYQMIGQDGKPLYIGKARSLAKRVVAYTRPQALPLRLQRMIAETVTMTFTLTHTEVEALLLECNLIKTHNPAYNILLKDDKSFAYIRLSDHMFPRLHRHRGQVDTRGVYFGPYASGAAISKTLTTLYKVFLVRSCADHVYKHRTRPCLEYHIKRCSAPCVGMISAEDYAVSVKSLEKFMRHRDPELIQTLSKRMHDASERMDYEHAAQCRDAIRALSHIQSQQGVNVLHMGSADVVAIVASAHRACVYLMIFRDGCNCGGTPYYFPFHEEESEATLLQRFLGLFYQDHPPPPQIFVSHAISEQNLLEEALRTKNTSTTILVPTRGTKRAIVEQASVNAREALEIDIARRTTQQQSLQAVAEALSLSRVPSRIEVYDNSHLFGTHAYGAMIVAGPEGFLKSSYRLFKFDAAPTPTERPHGIQSPPREERSNRKGGGDDYAMMRQVMLRRFAAGYDNKPDLMLIDGGQGQLHCVLDALAALGIHDIDVVAIAKGPDRNAGEERFFKQGEAPFQLPKHDACLHFLQRLRDEAHRFAIGAHRLKRLKAMPKSALDQIEGVGPTRKKALLHYFGSSYNVSRAGLQDLQKVQGIDKALAQKIYDYFHGS